MFAAGAAIGFSFGALIVQHFTWHATFFTIIPILISLLIVIWRFVHLDEGENNKHQWSNNRSTENVRSESSSMYQIGTFAAIAIISFIVFVRIERKERNPLVDLKLVLNKAILPANLIILIVGLLNFMVFQTIPILVRNPEPLGFGADTISTGSIQLPFALVFLVFGPTSGFIISKLGSLKPIIFGTIITSISFICILLFHSTEMQISANLGLLATGLSFAGVGAMNVIIHTFHGVAASRHYSDTD